MSTSGKNWGFPYGNPLFVSVKNINLIHRCADPFRGTESIESSKGIEIQINQIEENELWDFWMESDPETRTPFHILKRNCDDDLSETCVSDDYIKGFFDGIRLVDSPFPQVSQTYHQNTSRTGFKDC